MDHLTIGKQLEENIVSGRSISRDDLQRYIEALNSDLQSFTGSVKFSGDCCDFVRILTGWLDGVHNDHAFNKLEQTERLTRLCQLLEEFVSLLQDESDADRQVLILAEAQSLAFYTVGEAKEWREHQEVSGDIDLKVERAKEACDRWAESAITGAQSPTALAYLIYRSVPGGITCFLDWQFFYQGLRKFVEVCPSELIGLETFASLLGMSGEYVQNDLSACAEQCLLKCELPAHIQITSEVEEDGEIKMTLSETGLTLTTGVDSSWSLQAGGIKTNSVESVDLVDEFGSDDDWSVKVGTFLDQVANGFFTHPIALKVSMKRHRLEQIVSRPDLRRKLRVLVLNTDFADDLDVEAPNSLIKDNSLVDEREPWAVSQAAPAGLSLTNDSLNIEGEALDLFFGKTLDLFLAAETGGSAIRFGD